MLEFVCSHVYSQHEVVNIANYSSVPFHPKYSSIQISTIKMHFNSHMRLDLYFKLMVHLFHMLRLLMRYLGNFCQITAVMRLITTPARRACGVLNSPRFCFFCQCRKLGYRSWVIPLCILLSEPVTSRLLNSISTKLFHQNKQFHMYTTTSKQQEGSPSLLLRLIFTILMQIERERSGYHAYKNNCISHVISLLSSCFAKVDRAWIALIGIYCLVFFQPWISTGNGFWGTDSSKSFFPW